MRSIVIGLNIVESIDRWSDGDAFEELWCDVAQSRYAAGNGRTRLVFITHQHKLRVLLLWPDGKDLRPSLMPLSPPIAPVHSVRMLGTGSSGLMGLPSAVTFFGLQRAKKSGLNLQGKNRTRPQYHNQELLGQS